MMRSLHKERASKFKREVAPYFKYALMGGLTTTIVLLFLIGGYGYASILKEFPSQLPYVPILAFILTIVIFSSSFRTYIAAADLVYLLPMEREISSYLASVLRRSYTTHTIIILATAGLVLPLYKVGQAADGIDVSMTKVLLLALVFLVLKWFALLASWQEGQLRDSEIRVQYRWIRFFIIGLFVYLLLKIKLAAAVLIGTIMCLLYLFFLQKLPSFSFHWDYWASQERKARAQIYLFLSGFVDVPEAAHTIKRRKIFNFIDGSITLQRKQTMTFLYWKALQRSPLLAVMWRLMIVALICIIVFSSVYWKVAAFVLFMIALAVQATSLFSYHRHLVWMQVYPLPEAYRSQSVAKVTWAVHSFSGMILGLTLMFQLKQQWVWGLLLLVSSLLSSYIYFRKKAGKTMSSDI